MSIDTQLSDREKITFLRGYAKGWLEQTIFLKGWGDKDQNKADALQVKLDKLVQSLEKKLGLPTADATFEMQINSFSVVGEELVKGLMSK